MIGAEPNSGWLYGTVKLDKKALLSPAELKVSMELPTRPVCREMFAVVMFDQHRLGGERAQWVRVLW